MWSGLGRSSVLRMNGPRTSRRYWRSTGRRRPNATVEHTYQVVGANERGLIFTGKTMVPWTEAAKVVGRLVVKSKHAEDGFQGTLMGG
jgi:hypothetical protein